MGDGNISSRQLLDELTFIVSRAAAEILRIRHGVLNTRTKADASPVTDADEAAEAIILDELSRLLPGIAVVSEEAAARASPPRLGPLFALVDPIDGTREFIAGRDEYTVNVAIVENGRPQAGVIAAPARQTIWRGIVGQGAERLRLLPGAAPGQASEKAAIQSRRQTKPQIAALSRSHLDPATEAFLGRFPGIESVKSGSSLKFALVAEGSADIYPRLSPTSEWDIAAGDAIVEAAGGAVLTPQGQKVVYGRSDKKFLVPAFIAWGNPAAA